MILRRLTDALRQPDWVTVVIETLIVVFGVFIGLQVNNWNAERLERTLERDTLFRLHADILESKVGQTRDLRFLEQQIADQAVILKSLDRCHVTPEDDVAFQRGISTLGYINPPRFYRRTIDEIAASGRTDIISNSELAAELARIVALVEWRGVAYDSLLFLFTPHRYEIESQVRHDISRTLPDDYIAEHRSGVLYDIELLCQQPKLTSAISTISYYTDERRAAYAPLLDDYSELLEWIERELKARWNVSVEKGGTL